jgi:hypothetical protein
MEIPFCEGGKNMYEYVFVDTYLNGFFREDTHGDIIEQYATKGYRFVQLVPIKYNNYGKPIQYQLIFERKKN